jgi:PAS domain S-box-containing protein
LKWLENRLIVKMFRPKPITISASTGRGRRSARFSGHHVKGGAVIDKHLHPNHDDQLFNERLNHLYSNQTTGYIASAVNGAILTAVHWRLVSHAVLTGWLGFLLAIILGRAILVRQFHRCDRHLDRAALWKGLFMSGILASGIAWGLAGLLFFPVGSNAYQMFTVFTIGGMIAGASATYSVFPSFFLAFSLPAALPVILYSLSLYDGVHVAMSAMATLFLMLMMATCHQNYKLNLMSMRLKFENQDLVAYLSRANEQAESINQTLHNEINIRKQVESELEMHQRELASAVETRTAELKDRNLELQTEIKERARIEAALRESEERYRCLVENSIVGILVIQDQTILFANAFVAQASGIPVEKIVGTPFIKFIHPDDRELAAANYAKRVKGEPLPDSYPLRIVNGKGETNWWEVSAVKMNYESKPAILVFCRDITQQRNLELQLFQSEKMASIGQLAAGVAHEINNPVGFVISNLNTFKDYQQDFGKLIARYREALNEARQVPRSGCEGRLSQMIGAVEALESEIELDFLLDDCRQLIEECQEGTNRIKNIVQDLKSFAHPGEEARQFVDLNQCIESTLNIVWNELKYNANVIKEFGQIPELECYPQQLNQVFMNLLVNAGQAISGKGDVKILTRKRNSHIEILFSDTGCGIAEENLNKIFDPFFTTKPVGKGTGLGLHVSYNIIKKHNGEITVTSEKGKGTVFTIQLPL